MAYDLDTSLGGACHRFPTTRHSLVADASGGAGPPSREALGLLIAIYWKPAYKHVRIRWKRSNEDAKDLVQAFFTQLIESDLLARFDSDKARLRTYLCACLDRFVLKQEEFAHRLKRGGGLLEFDFDSVEQEISPLIAHTDGPEETFYREWQRELFALAIQELEQDYHKRGKQTPYLIFEQYDLAEGERPSYTELAALHQIPVSAVTNYLTAARRDLRRLVHARLRSVTASARECRAEMSVLFGG